MKPARLWLQVLGFVCGLLLAIALPSLAQVGNFSDVTAPSPMNLVPVPSDPAPEVELEQPELKEQILDLPASEAFQSTEQYFTEQTVEQLGLEIETQGVVTNNDIANGLDKVDRNLGTRTSLVANLMTPKGASINSIFPQGTRSQSRQASGVEVATNGMISADLIAEDTVEPLVLERFIPEAKQAVLKKVVKEFRTSITDIDSQAYLKAGQQLYQWLIAPIEPELIANKIDTLVFSMDSDLRSLPIAALHDGKQFLIEKYRIALIPSFGLTDTRYTDLSQGKVLALGASKFEEQNPLPAVPTEIGQVLRTAKTGRSLLNEEFTLENFKAAVKQQHPQILHLATHAEFKPGRFKNSYIQFWNTRLSMSQLMPLATELGWNQPGQNPIELIVLSACKTAVGDPQAELGFAGAAVAAGAKSALASLWYVSDTGTLALMSEFYQQLRKTKLRSEALRQAQLAMMRGQVRLVDDQLELSDQQRIPLPPELRGQGNITLTHPYYWSAFTMIGNWT